MTLQVSQINLQHSPTCQHELELFLSDQTLLAIAVSEPSWFLSNNTGYVTSQYRWLSHASHALTGIFVWKHANFKIVFSSSKVLALCIRQPTLDLYFLSVYLQPNTLDGLSDLRTCLAFLHSIRVPMVICGDFNGHSPLWFCQDRNAIGRQIEAFLVENNLQLANTPSSFPTFSNSSHFSSNIDLTLYSSAPPMTVLKWAVLPWIIPSSDQSLILTSFQLPFSQTLPTRIKWDAIDINHYSSFLLHNSRSLGLLALDSTFTQTEQYLARLLSLLSHIQEDFPHRRPSPHSKFWFKGEIKQLYHSLQ